MSNTTYSFEKDLEPVAMIGTSTHVLIVNPNFPAKTVGEFIERVKSQPGKLSYGGGGGPGSVSNLLMSLFLKRSGLEMISVSYRGTAPALSDLIAGHIPAMFSPLPEALSHAEAGKIRMLAVASEQRARQAPRVPSVAESGVPGFNGISWHGMLTPRGTPQSIIGQISSELARAANDPEFIQHLDAYGADSLSLGPEEFGKFIVKDAALWAAAVASAGVKLN
jgi:tripartite-type tricarboxylate transporter receptor subunit TctC